MKCAKCGEEIKSGNLYCSKCGAEVQIVSAYNVMEDEFFLDFRNQEIGDVSLRSVTNNRTALQKKNLYLSLISFYMIIQKKVIVNIKHAAIYLTF